MKELDDRTFWEKVMYYLTYLIRDELETKYQVTYAIAVLRDNGEKIDV